MELFETLANAMFLVIVLAPNPEQTVVNLIAQSPIFLIGQNKDNASKAILQGKPVAIEDRKVLVNAFTLKFKPKQPVGFCHLVHSQIMEADYHTFSSIDSILQPLGTIVRRHLCPRT